MPLDLCSIATACSEMKTIIVGGKVDKITQPEADEVRLFIRANGKNQCLVMSANPQTPRCHLTNTKRANPLTAPAFLMLLRKCLVGAILTDCEVYKHDRVLKFTFKSKSELLDETTYFVFVELMNRYSNIILTDNENKILDATKHIPFSIEREKCIMRGVTYDTIPQKKISFLDPLADALIFAYANYDDSAENPLSLTKEMSEAISKIGTKKQNDNTKQSCSDSNLNANSEKQDTSNNKNVDVDLSILAKKLDKLAFSDIDIAPKPAETVFSYLSRTLSGFASSTLTSLLSAALISRDTKKADLSVYSCALFASSLEKIRDNANGQKIFGAYIVDGMNEGFMPNSVGGFSGDVTFYPSLNEAMDAYYKTADGEVRIKSKIRTLSNAANRAVQKLEKQLAEFENKLFECENAEDFKIKGELLISNIYRLKKGMDSVTLENYYTNEAETIKLDPLKTPTENAESYFTKYQKLKRAKQHVTVQIEEKSALLEYVKSVVEMLKMTELDDNLSELENELSSVGVLKTQGGKNGSYGKSGGKAVGKGGNASLNPGLPGSKKNINAKKPTKNTAAKGGKKEKPQPPKCYIVDGFTVYAGKNNLQNDTLTFKTASAADIWLHLKNYHGSHVVIIRSSFDAELSNEFRKSKSRDDLSDYGISLDDFDGSDLKIPDHVIKIAAEIAAATMTAPSDVDFTIRRNVKRKPNSLPGMTTYTNFKTLLVSPDMHDELLVK